MDKYYKYNGGFQECEIKEILNEIMSKSTFYNCQIKLSDEFSKILSDDEFIEIELGKEQKPDIFSRIQVCGACGSGKSTLIKFPLIIPIINVNINIKAVTLTILALLLV